MLRKIAPLFRELGLGPGICYALDFVLSRLSPNLRFFAYELIAQPIPAESLLPQRAKAAIEVREIGPGDPVLALLPIPAEVPQKRFDQQSTCLGAFKKGELIGYMWFCPACYHEDEVRCTYVLEPAAESVFDYDFYIFPQYRMGRGFAALWDAANATLRSRGVSHTFSRVTLFNMASRRAHQHLGGRRLGYAFFLRLWRLEWMFSSRSPYLRASWGATKRAKLTLRAPKTT